MPDLLRAIEAFTKNPSNENQERMYDALRGRDEADRLQSALDPSLRFRRQLDPTGVGPAALLDPRSLESRALSPAADPVSRTERLLRDIKVKTTAEDRALLRAGGTLSEESGAKPQFRGQRLDVSPEHITIRQGGQLEVDAPPPPMPRTVLRNAHPLGLEAQKLFPDLDLDDVQGVPSAAAAAAGPYTPVIPRRSVVPAPETLADVLRTAGMRPGPGEGDSDEYDPWDHLRNPSSARRAQSQAERSGAFQEMDRTRAMHPSTVRAPAPSLIDPQGRVRDRAEYEREADDEFAHLTKPPTREERRPGYEDAMRDPRDLVRAQNQWDRLNTMQAGGRALPQELVGDWDYLTELLSRSPEGIDFMAQSGTQGEVERIGARSRFNTVANRPMSRGGGLYGVLADPATRARRDEIMKVRGTDNRGDFEYTRARPGSDDGFSTDGRRPLRVDLTTVGRRKVSMKPGDKRRLKRQANKYWKNKYGSDFKAKLKTRTRGTMSFRNAMQDVEQMGIDFASNGQDMPVFDDDFLKDLGYDSLSPNRRSALRKKLGDGYRAGLSKAGVTKRRERAAYRRAGMTHPDDRVKMPDIDVVPEEDGLDPPPSMKLPSPLDPDPDNKPVVPIIIPF